MGKRLYHIGKRNVRHKISFFYLLLTGTHKWWHQTYYSIENLLIFLERKYI